MGHGAAPHCGERRVVHMMICNQQQPYLQRTQQQWQ